MHVQARMETLSEGSGEDSEEKEANSEDGVVMEETLAVAGSRPPCFWWASPPFGDRKKLKVDEMWIKDE